MTQPVDPPIPSNLVDRDDRAQEHAPPPARRPLAALLSFLAAHRPDGRGVRRSGDGRRPSGRAALPDLEADSVGEIGSTADLHGRRAGTHLLLRFSSYIRNVGPGPLEVTGENPVNRSISGAGLNQVVTHDDLTKVAEPMPGAQLKYEETDGHNHWHFQKAARYSLWNDAKTPGDRVLEQGRLLLPRHRPRRPELQPAPSTIRTTSRTAAPWRPTRRRSAAARTTASPAPRASLIPRRGAAAALEDRHGHQHGLAGRVRADPALPVRGRVRRDSGLLLGPVGGGSPEPDPASRERGQRAGLRQVPRVPGYIAKPVNAGQISGIASKPTTSTITLSCTSFVPAKRNADAMLIGAAQYQITTQPEHGTLTQDPANAAKFLYTKDAGYNGPDDLRVRRPARPAASSRSTPTSAVGDDAGGKRRWRHDGGHQRPPGPALHLRRHPAERGGDADPGGRDLAGQRCGGR